MSSKNKFVWFFRLEGGGNQCTEYITECPDEAVNWLDIEYGAKATAAVRRELLFAEYAGLLRCQIAKDEGGGKAYQAIQDFFFRCDPRIAEGGFVGIWAEDVTAQGGPQ